MKTQSYIFFFISHLLLYPVGGLYLSTKPYSNRNPSEKIVCQSGFVVYKAVVAIHLRNWSLPFLTIFRINIKLSKIQCFWLACISFILLFYSANSGIIRYILYLYISEERHCEHGNTTATAVPTETKMVTKLYCRHSSDDQNAITAGTELR